MMRMKGKILAAVRRAREKAKLKFKQSRKKKFRQ